MTKEMNSNRHQIMLIAQATAKQIGGGEIAMALLANELDELGHSVVLVAESIDKGVIEIVGNNVKVIQFSNVNRKEIDSFPIIRNISFLPRLIRVIISNKPDIVCAGSEFLGIYSLLAKCLLGVPIILFKQFGVFENWKYLRTRTHFLFELIERKLLRFPFNAILSNKVTLNAALKEKVTPQKLFLHSMNLMPTIRYLDVPQTRNDLKLSQTENGILLLFAGRLEKVKGLHILIEALTDLVEDIKLLVLGSGSEEENLITLSKRIGVHDRITFVGQVSYLEVLSYITLSNIVVCPSLSELHGSRTMWDAFILKTPVVVTEVGDVPRLIKHGIHAVIVPPNDSHSLAGAISQIISHPDETERMTQNAFSLANEIVSKTGISGFINACHYVLKSELHHDNMNAGGKP